MIDCFQYGCKWSLIIYIYIYISFSFCRILMIDIFQYGHKWSLRGSYMDVDDCYDFLYGC